MIKDRTIKFVIWVSLVVIIISILFFRLPIGPEVTVIRQVKVPKADFGHGDFIRFNVESVLGKRRIITDNNESMYVDEEIINDVYNGNIDEMEFTCHLTLGGYVVSKCSKK